MMATNRKKARNTAIGNHTGDITYHQDQAMTPPSLRPINKTFNIPRYVTAPPLLSSLTLISIPSPCS